MAQIFVSYSRADQQFVDDLIPLLHRVYGNHNVWYDDQIAGGEDWWQLILSKIAECSVFIFLLSNESLTSTYCQKEVREALRLSKPILPVIVRPKTNIEKHAPKGLLPVLLKIHYVDMSQGFKDADANARLFASINRLLASTISPSARGTSPVNNNAASNQKRSRMKILLWLALIAIVAIIAVISLAIFRGQNTTIDSPTPSQSDEEISSITDSILSTLTPVIEPTATNTSATQISTGDDIPPGCILIAYGDAPLQGSIATAGEQDCYAFKATAGDLVRARGVKIGESDLNVGRAIYDSTNAAVCEAPITGSDIKCSLSETAIYTLGIFDFWRTGTGEYGVHLQRLNNPLGCLAVDLVGQTISASIANVAEEDCYTFTGVQGHTVRLLVSKTDEGDLSTFESVYDPAGQMVCETPVTTDQLDCMLQSNGPHTVFISDFWGPGTGSYNISIR